MTYTYRCCFCGSFRASSAALMRDHVFSVHRRRLLMGLGPIEYYHASEREIASSRYLKRRGAPTPGATGEGDSS